MSTLSGKSAQEISELLDEYGIQHGPVVDSTRALYEKKILEAMGKKKVAKPSPDKTFYREEKEEVTFVSYRTPLRSEGYGDGEPYSRSRPEYTQRDFQDEKPYLKSRSEHRSQDFVDKEPYSRSRPEYTQRDFQDEKPYLKSRSEHRSQDFVDKPYDTPSTYRTISYSNATPVKSSVPVPEEKSRLIPLWVQFVVFLVIAVFLYFVFCNMESTHSDPFKGIE